MTPRRRLRLWAHFLGVTLVLTIPVVALYLNLAKSMQTAEQARYRASAGNQLNAWQEQLNDLRWDAAADTYDDTVHLGQGDEAELLAQTLMWYVYPDGHCHAEGIAVVNPDGSLRPSKVAAVLDQDGEPLKPEVMARLKARRPWLDNPWLDDYAFVSRTFIENPHLSSYVSPFINAHGRVVLVIASAQRGADGKFLAAVMLQFSSSQVLADTFQTGARGQHIWLMDSFGRMGFATGPMAKASAEIFRSTPELSKAMARGEAASVDGLLGSSGQSWQALEGQRALLMYRTASDHFIIGLVVSEDKLVQAGSVVLRAAGSIGLLSILLLAVGGALYTFLALRREGAMVEVATLGRYAGTMSHRIRNDLSTVYGQLELISSGLVTDNQRIADAITGPVMQALDDIQSTVTELEALSRGEIAIIHEGQAGKNTMFKVGNDRGDGHK